MGSGFENTLLKPQMSPDLIQANLLDSKIRTLKNDPKGYREFQETIDTDEAISEAFRKPLETALIKLISKGDKSKETAKLLQIYGIRYLKLDPAFVGSIDGIYGTKTANIERIVFNKLCVKKPETQERKESPQELINDLLSSKALEKIGAGQGLVVLNDEILSICLEHQKSPDFSNTKFKDLGDKIKTLLQSPEGQKILKESIKIKNLDTYSQQFGLNRDIDNKTNIQKILKSFETQDQTYTNLQGKTEKLDSDIKRAINGSLPGTPINVMGCHGSNIPYQKEVSRLKTQYDVDTTNLFKGSIKDYLKTLLTIEPRSEILKQGGYTNFKIGNYPLELNLKPITEALNSNKLKSPQEIDNFLNSNIDKIFINSSLDRFKKGMDLQINNVLQNPDKFIVNVSAVIAGGIGAVLLTTETGGFGVLQAGLAYTCIHDAVKTTGYGFIGFMKGARHNDGRGLVERTADGTFEGMQEGIGYNPKETLSQYYTKKGFEWTSNTVLFGIFHGVEKFLRIKPNAETLSFRELETNLQVKFNQAVKDEYLGEIIRSGSKLAATQTLKIGTEATFFTSFQALSSPIENEILEQVGNSKDKKKFMEVFNKSMEELTKPENLGQSILYNIAFISILKAGIGIAEKQIQISGDKKLKEIDRIDKEYLGMGEKFQSEMNKLESKGYFLKNIDESGSSKRFVLVDKGGNKVDANNTDIQEITKLINTMSELSKKHEKLYQVILNNNLHRENKEQTDKNRGISTKQEDNELKSDEIKHHEKDSGRVGSGTNPDGLNVRDINLVDFVKGLDARENVRSDIKVSPRFEILMKEVYNIKDEAGLSPEIDKAVKLEISHLKDRIQETRAKNETEIHLEINGKVRNVKIEELEGVLGKLEGKMQIDFKDAIKQLLEIKQGTRNKLDGRFGNSEVVKDIMKPFVDVIESKGKGEHKKHEIIIP